MELLDRFDSLASSSENANLVFILCRYVVYARQFLAAARASATLTQSEIADALMP
jgi:hypothetical protein